MMRDVVTFLFVIHIYFMVRYCVGNILPNKDISRLTRLKHVFIVALVPLFGYFWVLREEDK